MKKPPPPNALTSAASPEAAYQRISQQAASSTLSLAEAQALLAELLAQQAALLLQNQQLPAAQELLASQPEDRLADPLKPQVAEPGQHADDKYRALFYTIDKGFCLFEIVYDAQGVAVDSRVLEVNPAYEQLTGLVNTQGRLGSEIAPHTEAYWLDTYAEVVRTGQPVRIQNYHQPTGRWYESYVARVGGAGSRQACIVFTDITERKRAEKVLQESEARQSFLLQLSDALGPLASAVAIQEAVTRVAQEFFQADRCYYGEIRDDQFIIHQDAAHEALPSVAGVYGLPTLPLTQAMVQAGQPLVVDDVHNTALVDDALRQRCVQLEIISFVDIPVIKKGVARGIFCVVQRTPRRWTALEVELAQETAERIWVALERAHAEATLRHSEARLRIALEAAELGTWDWNLTTNAVYWNARHFTLFGLAPQPAAPVTPADFERHVHPADRATVLQQLRTAIAEQTAFRAEFRALTAQGEERWMSGYGQVTNVSPDGQPQRMSGVVLDITERKRAEQQLQELAASLERKVAQRTQALQQSRDLLQSVYDTSLISMAVVQAQRDATGQITDFAFVSVNSHLEQSTGRFGLVGKHYAQEFPGIVPSGLLARMRQVVDTGTPQQLEYFYPYDGPPRWYATMFVKLDDGLVATTLDITERKQAEAERDRQLTLLLQAESMAQLGSWEYELATGAFHWSAGMYRLFGLPEGTPMQPSIYLDYALADDRPTAERLVQRILLASHDFEETLRLRVGTAVKTVRVRAVVVPAPLGQPQSILGVDLDLSEVRRLEADNLLLRLAQQRSLFEAVQHAQETERKRIAEALHNGVGQLLYATKLRLDQLHTPLLTTEPTLAAARHEVDGLLAQAIGQTRALSHELVPLALESFGLPAALQDICQKMSSSRLRFHCAIQLDEEVPPLPPALQLALYRMAQELVQNSVKHAHGATEAILELETMPGSVVLRMQDNGPGFRGASTGKPGLGLGSIRDRVALLGGTMDQGSLLPSGAYVRLRIPLAAPKSDPST